MRLKQLRLQKEITQIDLEVLTGIPAQRISLIERGYRQPTLIEKMKLAESFNVNVNAIDYPKRDKARIRFNMETTDAELGQD